MTMIVYPADHERGARFRMACLLAYTAGNTFDTCLGLTWVQTSHWTTLPNCKVLHDMAVHGGWGRTGILEFVNHLRMWMTPGQKAAMTRMFKGWPVEPKG